MSERTERQALAPGYTPVANGHLAAVVTYLEITQMPPLPLPVAPDGFRLRVVEKPDLDWYRDLFRAVGAPWLWVSRLRMSDSELRRTLDDPATEIFVAEQDGVAKGLLELHYEGQEEAELSFLGVTPEVVGSGLGRFLMEVALAQVIQRSLRRFWVHTCTLDHPRALPFYLSSGFQAYKRAVEVFADPRLTGELPLDAAPHVPVIRP